VNGKRYSKPRKRFQGWIFGAVILAAWSAGPARAQTSTEPGLLAISETPAAPRTAPAAPKDVPAAKPAVPTTPTAATDAAVKAAPSPKESSSEALLTGIVDPNVVQASCATCGGGGGLLHGDNHGGCATAGCASIGCNGNNCVPGRTHCCSICESDTCVGHILCGLYECICCPDRCYEPEYIPAANAAFFVDSARPVTQTRLRFDGMYDIANADRAEYLLAGYKVSYIKTWNCFPGGTTIAPGKGVNFIPGSVDLTSLSLYTEAARGMFSAFVSMPYDHFEPSPSVANASLMTSNPVCPSSGFGDMTIGTKSLLLDCDLLQFSFQFSTFLPIGNFMKGLGTGHVSLEPAFLFTLKLTPDCYFQGELAYWIPIAGDQAFQGNVNHNHFSFNHVLCRILPDVQLIGTLECINYNVIGGNYTATNITSGGLAVPISGTASMFSAGPGVRLDVCKRLDFGAAVLFNTTGARYADEEVRVEVRLRF
jgi:hypothetical protein